MRKAFIALAAGAALVHSPALAADMVYNAPVSPPPPIWSWTGLYIGVDGGYGWNEKTGGSVCINPKGDVFGTGCTLPSGPVTQPTGGLFGGEAGYNLQRGRIVVGIETDLQWSGIAGSGTALLSDLLEPKTKILPGPVATYTATNSMDWFGTTRARIGVVNFEQLLLYATGGAIYAKETATATGVALPGHVPAVFPATGATTRAGGIVGGGLEYAFNSALSAKIEGFYYDMGTLTAAFTCPGAGAMCTPGYAENGKFALRGSIWPPPPGAYPGSWWPMAAMPRADIAGPKLDRGSNWCVASTATTGIVTGFDRSWPLAGRPSLPAATIITLSCASARSKALAKAGSLATPSPWMARLRLISFAPAATAAVMASASLARLARGASWSTNSWTCTSWHSGHSPGIGASRLAPITPIMKVP
jgi:outer membrane immunogenic protein